MAQGFQFAISVQDGDIGVVDTVECIRLYSSIMEHIFEDDVFTYPQFVVELPGFHPVAAQAAVSAQAVSVFLSLGEIPSRVMALRTDG